MIFPRMESSTIAKERLKLMMETDELEHSSVDVSQLKKEISILVGRYFNISPELFEIKITLKQDKKRD